MNVCVYTAVLGGCPDELYEPPPFPGVRYVAFTDRPAPGWETPKRIDDEEDPRRAARFYKCLPHVVLPGEHLTVWVDGTHQVQANMTQYVLDALKNLTADFATFKHRERVCLYQEVRACLQLQKDRPDLLLTQARRYESEGFPYYHGLCETPVVVRANTPSVRTLGQLWWQEIRQGSARDQVSLPYVLWKLRRSYVRLPGWAHVNPQGFRFHPHWQSCVSAST